MFGRCFPVAVDQVSRLVLYALLFQLLDAKLELLLQGLVGSQVINDWTLA